MLTGSMLHPVGSGTITTELRAKQVGQPWLGTGAEAGATVGVDEGDGPPVGVVDLGATVETGELGADVETGELGTTVETVAAVVVVLLWVAKGETGWWETKFGTATPKPMATNKKAATVALSTAGLPAKPRPGRKAPVPGGAPGLAPGGGDAGYGGGGCSVAVTGQLWQGLVWFGAILPCRQPPTEACS